MICHDQYNKLEKQHHMISKLVKDCKDLKDFLFVTSTRTRLPIDKMSCQMQKERLCFYSPVLHEIGRCIFFSARFDG